MKSTKNKVEEFIRVDHAGERGAVKIYEGQLLELNTLVKDDVLKKTIEEMKIHEKNTVNFLRQKLKKEKLNQQIFTSMGFIGCRTRIWFYHSWKKSCYVMYSFSRRSY